MLEGEVADIRRGYSEHIHRKSNGI